MIPVQLLPDDPGRLLDEAYKAAEIWVQYHTRSIADCNAQLKRVKGRPSNDRITWLKAEVERHEAALPFRQNERDKLFAAMIALGLPIPILTYDEIAGTYAWSYPE